VFEVPGWPTSNICPRPFDPWGAIYRQDCRARPITDFYLYAAPVIGPGLFSLAGPGATPALAILVLVLGRQRVSQHTRILQTWLGSHSQPPR